MTEESNAQGAVVSTKSNLSSGGLVRRLPWVRLVAEFGVIFLGVTVGLLADDWRQSREDRADERSALEEMLADLEADAEGISAFAGEMRDDDINAFWIRMRLGRADVSVDRAATAIRRIFNNYTYSPPRATYAGLRSTGRLVLIQDDAIRRRVTRYYEEEQDRLIWYYQAHNDYWRGFREAVGQDWVLEYPEDQRDYTPREGIGFGLRLQMPWAEFPTDPKALYYLDEMGVIATVARGNAASVLESNFELQELIRGHLER